MGKIGNNFKGFRGYYLKAMATIWPSKEIQRGYIACIVYTSHTFTAL